MVFTPHVGSAGSLAPRLNDTGIRPSCARAGVLPVSVRSVTDDALRGLDDIAGLDQLHTLQLHSCNQITDASLARLSSFPQLKGLDLEGCTGLSDIGLAYLSALTHLEWLSLAGCRQITDIGMGYLSQLTGLRVLNLGGCQRITDTGLIYLRKLTGLRSLDLRGTSRTGLFGGLVGKKGISGSCLASFRGALPHCEIIET